VWRRQGTLLGGEGGLPSPHVTQSPLSGLGNDAQLHLGRTIKNRISAVVEGVRAARPKFGVVQISSGQHDFASHISDVPARNMLAT